MAVPANRPQAIVALHAAALGRFIAPIEIQLPAR